MATMGHSIFSRIPTGYMCYSQLANTWGHIFLFDKVFIPLKLMFTRPFTNCLNLKLQKTLIAVQLEGPWKYFAPSPENYSRPPFFNFQNYSEPLLIRDTVYLAIESTCIPIILRLTCTSLFL